MKLKPNVGKTDKLVRYVIGVIALVIGYTSTGSAATVAYVVAAAAIITASINYCGLYSILGINTCKAK